MLWVSTDGHVLIEGTDDDTGATVRIEITKYQIREMILTAFPEFNKIVNIDN